VNPAEAAQLDHSLSMVAEGGEKLVAALKEADADLSAFPMSQLAGIGYALVVLAESMRHLVRPWMGGGE
jgi:hypothetical protein